MVFNTFIKEAHKNSLDHGFWEDVEVKWLKIAFMDKENKVDVNAIGNRLMLITGEVAEAHEALRKNDRTNFAEELADIVIRVADLCGGLGIDLEKEIITKMAKNKLREYKHGKAF